MISNKSSFALIFGNRGFFPAHYIREARDEVAGVLSALGHPTLVMDVDATNHGGIETPHEGTMFREFYRIHRDSIDGIILSLPNFGDENGVLEALREVDVPILIQAYPDEIGRLGPKERRDSFCGKLSIMDVFKQAGIRFTIFQPHTVHPNDPRFAVSVAEFDKTCRVVRALRELNVGAIGARTTPFKTVRVDEVALQKHGISVETVDLSDVFQRMDAVDDTSQQFAEIRKHLRSIANWNQAPEGSLEGLVRLKIVLRDLQSELRLETMALRCWSELQKRFHISPCLVTGSLADEGMPVACEVDIANAIVMLALGRASGEATSILDWNNNYGADPDKCILFHCGNVPTSLMKEKGTISDHHILATTVGIGNGFGCNQGRIKEMEFTYSSMMTEDGAVKFYLGTGSITPDPIPPGFFGCAGVARIEGLQDVLQWIGYSGHRHHVSITPGNHVEALREAFEKYLGFEVKVFQ